MKSVFVMFLAAAFGLAASQTSTGCLETGEGVCKIPCPNGIWSCPSGTTREIVPSIVNGDTFCNCIRPYTDEELKELDDKNCAAYISQCLTGKEYVYSCQLTSDVCSTQAKFDMCQLAVEKGKQWVYNTCSRYLTGSTFDEFKDRRDELLHKVNSVVETAVLSVESALTNLKNTLG